MHKTEITPEFIIELISDYYRLDKADVLSLNQKAEYVKARQLSMWFIKDIFPVLSLGAIGRYFPGRKGLKDHATVIHTLKNVKNLKDTNRIYLAEFKQIVSILSKCYDIQPVLPESINMTPDESLIAENNTLRTQILGLQKELSGALGNVRILTQENNFLGKKVAKLKELSNLCKIKAEVKEDRQVPVKSIKPVSKYAEIEPYNGRGFSGYRQHSL